MDLAKRRFGRLVVMEFVGINNHRKAIWLCQCDCGRSANVLRGGLLSGKTRSCGCLHDEVATQRVYRHGQYGTPTYRTWAGMIARCTNPNEHCYGNYGGRGIKVDARWMLFENFYEDMGDKPPSLTIERINNDGNYEKGNCRWASRPEQTRNTRKTRRLTLDGVTKCISEWARDFGVSTHTIARRLRGKPLAIYKRPKCLPANRYSALDALLKKKEVPI